MADKKQRIVIVDDDEDLLRLLLAAFKSEGFETIGISNGTEALSYLMDETNIEGMNLLILDRMLPDMDGVEILKRFKSKYQSKIPVLILSVLSADKDVMEGLKKGAVDYISKPFNLKILIQKARALITR